MNQINRLKCLFSKSKVFTNYLSYNRYHIKSIIFQNKGRIIFGTFSLVGLGFTGYVLINNKSSSNIQKSESLFFSDLNENSTKSSNRRFKEVDLTTKTEIKTESKEDITNNQKQQPDSPTLITDATSNLINGIPTEVPYIIIGAGIAGMSAARSIRASDPFAKVLIINSECQNPGKHAEMYPPYRRLLLSKFIWKRSEEQQNAMMVTSGDVKSGSLLFIEPDTFFVPPENLNQLEYGGISLLNGTRVVAIDPDESSVTLDRSGHKIMYKACLIATGSHPRRLKHLEKSNNTDKDLYKDGRVSYFRSLNDYRNLFDFIKELQAKENGGRILIVGSGLLGTELTSSLSRVPKQQGKLEIIEVFKEKSHLHKLLPEALSAYLKQYLGKENVKFIPESEVVSIGEVTDGIDAGRLRIGITALTTSNKDNISSENVDHVIIAAGVEPDTSLLEHARLESDHRLGGFVVNSQLQAREGIYVAGDACSFYDPVLGCRRRVEHWDHSEESGHIAGHNMAAFVLSRHHRHTLSRINTDILANSILAPKNYTFQSSFSFKMSMYKTVEALGLIDSSLETKTFIAEDFFDELDVDDIDDTEKKEMAVTAARKTRDRLDMPGVVFYLRQKRVVGILLWNCDDDIIIDSDFPSPLRSNVARKILSERRLIDSHADLVQLAADFDLSFFVNSQVKFLDEYTKKMKLKQEEEDKNKS